MSYNIISIPPFEKQLKRLSKKYESLKIEFAQFIDSIEKNPFQGTALANSCYKIRLSIKSKGKGKRGGARIIIHVVVSEQEVFLLTIYDKSEQNNISNKELKDLLRFLE